MLLFQAILLFLFPLGLYCLVLAYINRRDRPLLLSGVWDVALMLGAGAGFFLVLLPTLLDQFYHRAYIGAVGTDTDPGRIWERWWLAWAFYYAVLVAGAALLLWWRRHVTVIYNVNTEVFPAIFAQAARLANLACRALPDTPDVLLQSTDGMALASVQIETFTPGSHITLHWRHYTPATRRDVEQALDRLLEQARAEDNSLSGWFLVLSGLDFGLIALAVLALYVLVFLRSR